MRYTTNAAAARTKQLADAPPTASAVDAAACVPFALVGAAVLRVGGADPDDGALVVPDDGALVVGV